MIEQLFGSKTRVKLLRLFCENPNRSFYVREITRKIDEQINSVRRELANLLSIGIITSDNTNNKLYYEVNQAYDYYEPLRQIFGTKQKQGSKKQAKQDVQQDVPVPPEQEVTASGKDPFVAAIARAGNIDLVVYTGQFTLDDTVGVDIVVVGNVNTSQLDVAIGQLEKEEKKVLRYSVFDPDEFRYRRQVNDRFVSNLRLAKKIVVVDNSNLL